MAHVVLLGDSVFDNGAYVGAGPDVIAQVRERLPTGSTGTLAAVDGALIGDVARQMARVPANTTHLVVSAGGNDALMHSGVLAERAGSMAEALDRLRAISTYFEREYGALLETVVARRLPTAVCTIYYPRYPEPVRQRLAVQALAVPNDVILRHAFARGLPVLDLRLICDRDEDYANPIEPSSVGGAKIADAIVRLLATHDFGRGRTEVYAR
jgi:GDSL-like Lipase/Acylhydrolase family